MSSDLDLVPTPSQTVGPFFHIGLRLDRSLACLAGPRVKGERVRLECVVWDGDGMPVDDALLEIWQADSEGHYHHPQDPAACLADSEFGGFGRMATGEDGACTFATIKPGRVLGPGQTWQAPHLNLSVFARGLLKRLATRVYFAGDPAHQHDPILALVPKERRDTLMAHPDPAHPGSWRFEIHLSGERETVFFDV